jgi:hypothetical protein
MFIGPPRRVHTRPKSPAMNGAAVTGPSRLLLGPQTLGPLAAILYQLPGGETNRFFAKVNRPHRPSETKRAGRNNSAHQQHQDIRFFHDDLLPEPRAQGSFLHIVDLVRPNA